MLPNPLKRAALLIGALALLALSSPVASASAAETSQITSPAGPTYAFYDETLPPPPPAFTVEGTTTISGKIALRCYYGAAVGAYATVVGERDTERGLVLGGGRGEIRCAPGRACCAPCRLPTKKPTRRGRQPKKRRTPTKDLGSSGSRFELFKENGITYDYEIEPSTLAGLLRYRVRRRLRIGLFEPVCAGNAHPANVCSTATRRSTSQTIRRRAPRPARSCRSTAPTPTARRLHTMSTMPSILNWKGKGTHGVDPGRPADHGDPHL